MPKLPILMILAGLCLAAFSSTAKDSVQTKLDKIIIPKVQFEDASISAVFHYLKQRSKSLDPDREGVNFMLKLKPVGKGAKEQAGEGGSTRRQPEPSITMDFDNIPLGDLIRYVCKAAGLKYRVEKHAVIVAHPSVPLDRMQTRIYTIGPGVLDPKPTR